MSNPITREQIGRALDFLKVLADIVRSEGEIPSEQLFGFAAKGGMSRDAFQRAVALLKKARIIRETDTNTLRWIEVSYV